MIGFLQVYGYKDSGSPTGWNIGTVPQQLISSFLNIGTIIGVLLTTMWGKYFGRRSAIWLASLISFVAAGLQVGTTNLIGLYFGRILIGVSNGFYITFANVYTAEVSPAHLRGAIVSFFGIWVSIGSILGAVANNFSKDLISKHSYQIPLASLFVIPTFLSLVVIFIPESPRWLLVQGRSGEAKRALERLRGASFRGREHLLEEEFEEMQQGIHEEKEMASTSSIRDMFRGTDLRRTLLCFAVILSHSSSGLWLIIAYGVSLHSPWLAPGVPGLTTRADVLLPDGWCRQTFPSDCPEERMRPLWGVLWHISSTELHGASVHDAHRSLHGGAMHAGDCRS